MPSVENRIPLYKVAWEEEDVEAVSKVIRRGMYWGDGPEIREFERKVAEYVGVRYGVATNSGTSALYALLQALNVKTKHMVASPSWTYISTVNPILIVGGEVVFVDVEYETMGLNPDELNNILLTKPVKTVIAVNVGGSPCLLEEINEMCEKNNVTLVIDDAESLGATIRGRKTASYGVASVLSFAANKIISTGEGGMVVTDDEKLAEKVRLYASYLGAANKRGDIHGANLRMSCLNASLGLSQLKRIEENIAARRRVANIYEELLLEEDSITIPVERAGERHVYQMYTVKIPIIREMVKTYLENRGINCKVYFDPIHLSPNYYRGVTLPVTEHLQKICLSLPIYPKIEEGEIDTVVSLLRDALKTL